jgi:hypothetical protein
MLYDENKIKKERYGLWEHGKKVKMFTKDSEFYSIETNKYDFSDF